MHNLKLIWDMKLSGKTEMLNSWKNFPYLESVEKPQENKRYSLCYSQSRR